MPPTSRRTSFWFGFTLTMALAGAILLAPLARERVPRTGVGFREEPDLVICSTAPGWVQPGSPALDRAVAFLADHGLTFRQIYAAECAQMCQGETLAGGVVYTVCQPQAVLVDLAPPSLPDVWGGACMTDDKRPWATVVVRESPEVAADLLLAHELAHCRGFLGHVRGPSFYGLVLAPKPGHLLHPDLTKAGWRLTALPE